MNPKHLFVPLLLCLVINTNAAPPTDSTEFFAKQYKQYVDSVDNTLKYQTGKIDLQGGHVLLNVPAGFKYLNKEQSRNVITELWGNPSSSAQDLVGMIFPENAGPLSDSSFAFVVTYSGIGYIKDEDANDIDYDDMLKEIQDDEKEENTQRMQEGYEPIHMIGWAQKPFYDKERKILNWAKDLKFGDNDEAHTLNYDIRIL